MTYELAKKLKDAGFPGSEDWTDHSNHYERGTEIVPTLSELIEACGEKFDSLERGIPDEGEWRAYTHEGQEREDPNGEKYNCERDCCGYQSGDTPEEAVANLWLALNQKP